MNEWIKQNKTKKGNKIKHVSFNMCKEFCVYVECISIFLFDLFNVFIQNRIEYSHPSDDPKPLSNMNPG